MLGGKKAMKKKAYVLVDAERGQAVAVAAELSGKHGILAADPIFGRHDVIATIEADDLNGLVKLVRDEIAQAEHVTHTETFIVAPAL
jgi:DNA-binding Lrp family transcriptional regulator